MAIIAEIMYIMIWGYAIIKRNNVANIRNKYKAYFTSKAIDLTKKRKMLKNLSFILES